MEFSDSIRKIRTEHNLTQQQLADRLYVSRQAVSNWENDKNLPDLPQVIEIANVFHVSLDELILGGNNEMSKMSKKLIDDSTIALHGKRNNTWRTVWMTLLLIGLVCLFIKAALPESVQPDGTLQETFFLLPLGFAFSLFGLIVLIIQFLMLAVELLFKKEKDRSNMLSFFICLSVLLLLGGLLGLLISANGGSNLSAVAIIELILALFSSGITVALVFIYKKQ